MTTSLFFSLTAASRMFSLLLFSVTSASPIDKSSFTTEAWPLIAARCNAVFCEQSTAKCNAIWFNLVNSYNLYCAATKRNVRLSPVAHQFRSMKRLGVFLPPPLPYPIGGSTPPSSKFVGNHFIKWICYLVSVQHVNTVLEFLQNCLAASRGSFSRSQMKGRAIISISIKKTMAVQFKRNG